MQSSAAAKYLRYLLQQSQLVTQSAGTQPYSILPLQILPLLKQQTSVLPMQLLVVAIYLH
jgi:hypothetical protein